MTLSAMDMDGNSVLMSGIYLDPLLMDPVVEKAATVQPDPSQPQVCGHVQNRSTSREQSDGFRGPQVRLQPGQLHQDGASEGWIARFHHVVTR